MEPDIGLTLQKIKMGYRFIAESIDFLFLGCIKLQLRTFARDEIAI